MLVSKCCESGVMLNEKAVSSDEMHMCLKCLRACITQELEPLPLEFYYKLFKTIKDEPTSETPGGIPAESH